MALIASGLEDPPELVLEKINKYSILNTPITDGFAFFVMILKTNFFLSPDPCTRSQSQIFLIYFVHTSGHPGCLFLQQVFFNSFVMNKESSLFHNLSCCVNR